jgi:hypothetical protein
MKKALQILYGTVSRKDNQESQFLLHSTFCNQYSVTSDYSSLNYLGTNPLGSLALICFPTEESLIKISHNVAIPESVFQKILSFLAVPDQLSARSVMKTHNTNGVGANGNGNGSSRSESRRRPGKYCIDPLQLRSNILAPKVAETQVKYVNMEVFDEESQYVDDIVVEEPTYLDIVNVAGKNKLAVYVSIALCVGLIVVIIYLIIII